MSFGPRSPPPASLLSQPGLVPLISLSSCFAAVFSLSHTHDRPISCLACVAARGVLRGRPERRAHDVGVQLGGRDAGVLRAHV